MTTITITKVIELRWKIIGHDGYYFGLDKRLYNAKRGKEIKKTLNGRSIGYWIGRKFYSINKIKPLLARPDNFNLPF